MVPYKLRSSNNKRVELHRVVPYKLRTFNNTRVELHRVVLYKLRSSNNKRVEPHRVVPYKLRSSNNIRVQTVPVDRIVDDCSYNEVGRWIKTDSIKRELKSRVRAYRVAMVTYSLNCSLLKFINICQHLYSWVYCSCFKNIHGTDVYFCSSTPVETVTTATLMKDAVCFSSFIWPKSILYSQ